jgi:3'(2'), 5'-bisphosphate nucleotidase
MSSFINESFLERVIAIARESGRAVMEIYGKDFSIRTKADSSALTEADEQSERLILEGLKTLSPDLPVVSEESAAIGNIPDTGHRFWLVDPLDGTREFIKHNGEFTINIALVDGGTPALGVVFAPALDRLFAGAAHLNGFVENNSGRQAIACRHVPPAGLTVVSSRSHGDTEALKSFLSEKQVASYVVAGSSLKFCMVAAGEADIYPRLGRTMEWDTAAAHAVLSAAGGRIVQLNGNELTYGKAGFANPHFVAFGLDSPFIDSPLTP